MRALRWALMLVLVVTGLTLTVGNRSSARVDHTANQVYWLSFSDALRLAKINGKKVLVDVYTDWCGWCKIMDQKTYSNGSVVNYINQKYFAVKLDAWTTDVIEFQGMEFGPLPGKKEHQLAYMLLDGKMAYPTTVIMDPDGQILSPVQGYLDPETMEKVLRYYGEDIYLTTPWKDYEKSF